MPNHATSSSLKQKALEEFKLFWVIAIYLWVMLAAFAWYRQFVLATVSSAYFHYGAAAIEALVLAKVILIGEALGVGRRFEGARLMLSALYKSIMFGVLIAIFGVLEHVVVGLVHHESWDAIGASVISAGRDEMLARTVMVIVTLIPFFAFWEADRVMGNHRLFHLFFKKGTPDAD